MEQRLVLDAGVAVNDLMVVGYSSDNDTVALMATVNIPNGQTVFLTDRGFNSTTGLLRAGSTFETMTTWVTGNNITAGTIIHISGPTAASFIGTAYGTLSGAFTLDGTSGDQVLIFQTADNNAESTPVFVSAFNGDRPADLNVLNDDGPFDGWSDSDVGLSAATSHLPGGLTASDGAGNAGSANGMATFAAATELDDYVYSGPTSAATRATWISRINTAANWTGSDTPITLNASGSLNGVTSLPFPTPPTATIIVADTSLIAGENSLVTFTFSEAVTGFTNADITVANGTLTAVSSANGGVTWTATLTPTANLTDLTNVISVDLTGVSGLIAGVGTATSNNYAIDTLRPTATIVVADTSLIAGETSLVTITFSEAVTGFTNADLTVANGTLSAVSSGDGGVTWTATLTPAANTTDSTNVVTLANTGVSDGAGNAGTGTTNSNNYAIDTARPTATIVVADTSLIAGETSLVTITFSEAVTGFTNADLSVANGTLSAVSSGDGGVTWTATLTPTSNLTDSTNVITLANTGVNDAAGNAGTGTTNSNNYAIDTQRPTATIVVADSALTVGETSLVTITFSEAVTGFTNADLTIPNGTLSAVSSADGGVTWTATFTPTVGINDATNVIVLDNTGVTDAPGNAGTGTTNSNNFTIDTVVATAPTATIVVADTSLIVGETSLVTITFSEAVTGFTNADLTVANGTLSAVSSGDGGVTWTATLTPTANVTDATNVITLDLTGVAGAIAGVGTQDSNNYAIDTQRPTATIGVSDTLLKIGDTSLITITFSEAVTGFNNSDLTFQNGTLSPVSSSDGGVTWTATFTPSSNTTDISNDFTLANTGVTDAAGNTGSGTTTSLNYVVDTVRPTATIVVADSALTVGETSLVTITFSEAVAGFDNSDLTIPNGTLTAVSTADGGVTWTATFTPTAGINDATNVITLDNTGVTDGAGNAGTGVTNSANFTIDTVLLTGADFGDLPNSFGTLLASNGARHDLSTLFLGTSVNADADGQPSAGANLDTSDNGVVLPATLVPGMAATVSVTASQAGKLDAFIDFNDNDAFDANERITPVGGLSLSAGVNSVTFVVPVDAVAGAQGARFRLSSAGGLGAIGAAADGEVEDYLATVVSLATPGIQQVADPENSGQTMVIVTGTSGNDKIYVYPISGGFRASVNGTLTATLTATSRVVTFALGGNDLVQYLNVALPGWIDGGDGNDTLTGSNGDDVIFGRAGNDTITGKNGSDAMFGGTGNDKITGNGILVGGDDVDTLCATGPRNLMIGGLGADTLKAATGSTSTGDIMIGSWTDWDNNLAALKAIRAEWAAADSLNNRMGFITGNAGGLNGPFTLYSDAVGPGTVHDDAAVDTFCNTRADDWLFVFAGDIRKNSIGVVNHPA